MRRRRALHGLGVRGVGRSLWSVSLGLYEGEAGVTGQVEDNPREQPAFHQAKEKTASEQSLVIMYQGLKGRYDSPGGAQEWQDDTRADLLEHQI